MHKKAYFPCIIQKIVVSLPPNLRRSRFLRGGWWWVLYILMAFIGALYLTCEKLRTLFLTN